MPTVIACSRRYKPLQLGVFRVHRYIDSDRAGVGKAVGPLRPSANVPARDRLVSVGHALVGLLQFNDRVDHLSSDPRPWSGRADTARHDDHRRYIYAEERAKMQAFFSGVWGFSSVVGPVVGGFITDQISWRWVFFINVPVGIVAATIIGFALKEPKQKQKPTIDYAGAILLMLAISLLMLAMVEGVKSLATIVAPVISFYSCSRSYCFGYLYVLSVGPKTR